mmetsp:Transcript_144410/g.204219  ORF Transcript_144410/g.204219 Transcript_144410/m.204219 type:complete len:292 (+) Transcript_144410:3-878(+)
MASGRLATVQRHLVAGRRDAQATAVSAPSSRSQPTTDEWALRCDLAVAYRAAYLMGWHQELFNHITVKIPNSDSLPHGPHFLINPFGLQFSEVTAGSLLRVGIDGTIIDKGTSTGILLGQGFIVHSAIHAAREDMHCVVHCHHQPTVAVAMTKHGVLPMSQEIVGVYNNISYHPFEGTALDPAERGRMAKSLGPKNKILILENHGPLTGGKTLAEAMFLMFRITRHCEYQAQAMAAVGGDVSQLLVPTQEAVDEMAARDAPPIKYNPPKLQFESWRRRVETKWGADNVYAP